MPTRFVLLLVVMILVAGCGGGDKHLPSSNPPEYDPKKVCTAPAAPLNAPATVAKPTDFERLKSQLESLKASHKQSGAPFSARKDLGWSLIFNDCRFRTFNTNREGYEIGGWAPVRDADLATGG